MGLWEDAQAQAHAQEQRDLNVKAFTDAQVQRMQAEDAKLKQSQIADIAEFIKAMEQLGVAPNRYPVYAYLKPSSDIETWGIGEVGSESGWALASYWAEIGSYRKRRVQFHTIITPDGALIETGDQEIKGGKKPIFGRTKRNLIRKTLRLPVWNLRAESGSIEFDAALRDTLAMAIRQSRS